VRFLPGQPLLEDLGIINSNLRPAVGRDDTPAHVSFVDHAGEHRTAEPATGSALISSAG
jgi:hypothetical protein